MTLTRSLAVVLATLVASCGGGNGAGPTGAFQAPAPALRAAAGSLSTATPAESANALMDWAESQAQFHSFFPEHQVSLTNAPPFLYRHYSSGAFLGVVVTNDSPFFPFGGVYVLGGVFGGAPVYVGQVTDFPATPPAAGPLAAATCPALTSATYRVIKPAPAGQSTVIDLAAVVMDNAGTPQIAYPGRPSTTMTAGATSCSFSLPDGSGVVVSSAGVALMSSPEGANRNPVMLFPEQTVPLSELAGTWNRLSWTRKAPGGLSQPYTLSYGTIALNTEGTVTGGQECSVAADLSGGCTASGVTGTVVVDPEGGFSGTGDLNGGRLFAYKSGTNLMVVSVDPDGSLTIVTPQSSLGLPTAGTVNSAWNLNANTAGVLAVAGTNAMPGISTTVNTITSVDSLTSVVVRNSSQDGASATSQTLRYNVPLAGFRKRDGATGVAPSILMPVRGMGLTAVSRLGAATPTTPGTGNGFLALSVDQH